MTEAQPESEAELARRCAEGDPQAWERFVRRYVALLASLARRMLGRALEPVAENDVDEVVAEVFLALLRRDRLLLQRYDPAFRLSTYLGVICRTEVGRLLRRRQREPGGGLRHAEEVAAAGSPVPLEALLSSERAAALGDLRAALARLGERDRLLLTLRFLEGRDYRAIGALLGLSPESVGQLLKRAKDRLAAELPALRRLIEEP